MRGPGFLILGGLGLLALSQPKAEAAPAQAEAEVQAQAEAEAEAEVQAEADLPAVPEEAPVLMTLRFSNPRTLMFGPSAVKVWDAQIYNLEAHQWITGKPLGVKELHVPMGFDIDSTTFLLKVMEMAGQHGPYWYGPYLVEAFPFGAYTWNSREGRIDGIKAIDLPATVNETDIVGVISKYSWVKGSTPWACTIQIEEASSVDGKDSWAQLFPSIYCYEARLPLDTINQPLIKEGARVTCKARIKWGEYAAHWEAWGFRLVRPYPDDAYRFGGYIRYTVCPRVPYEMRVFVDLSYGVSGTAPFRAVLVQWGRFGYPINVWPISGSGTMKKVNTWHGNTFAIYANPNPQKPFHWNLLPVEDWVGAGSANVVEWAQWAPG